MSRKKKSSKSAGKKHNNERRAPATPFNISRFRTENVVIALLDEAGSLSEEKICTEMIEWTGPKDVQKSINDLVSQGFVQRSGEKYTLNPRAPLFRGRLTQNIKGFGFVTVDGVGSRKADRNDPYIPKQEIRGAIHGDRLLIRQIPQGQRRRPEFTVIRVIEEAPNILCGILREKGGFFLVTPDNSRIPFKIRLEETALGEAKPGDVVRVSFDRAGDGKNRPGRILAILGSPALIDTQMQLAIEKFELPHKFSDAAIARAKSRTISEDEFEGRVDLRHTMHVTIDGATAKDFDDAICVEKSEKGTRLFVSIADVSHYVTPGNALDNEAYERGTSVYFPGRVIPMLPEELSNNLCSLVPLEDRLTMTAEMEFDAGGKMVNAKFYRSVILSKRRYTYDRVWQLLEGAAPEDDAPFLPMLRQARELAEVLRGNRLARGAIDFNLREPVYILDEKGGVASIEPAQRNEAHRLIEEFMLIANEAVAQHLTSRITHPLFRIHEKPDAAKIKDFVQFSSRLGEQLPKFNKEPQWFSIVLDRFKGGKYEYIINNLLLRSLTQAQYSTEESGHFGLASPAYTHFTSPIRRYPDLIVHRMLSAIFEAGGKKSRKQKFAPAPTGEAATFLSQRERIAVDAERDMNDRLKVAYMKDKVGEHFKAVISGVSENTLFVELLSPCVSGAIPLEMLGDDYFFFDSQNFRVYGELTRQEYQLGDQITVELTSVSMSRRQLTFHPVQEK
jgi:ribonuclease R